MNNWELFADKIPLLMQKLWQQIYLSVGAVLIAMLISIPLGIWIARKEKIKNYILGVSSVLQTLPSLAVLGFLLPWFGIGVKTAIITLIIYSMLPIIRNTVTGFLGIAPDLLEAADGLGFTKWQKMRIVELPLALPVMVAGIRTATVMSVGIATLAAFIGAGGLGDFIYEGLSLNNTSLILWGAIPAALLALVLDYMIAKIEQTLIAKKMGIKKITSTKKIWIISIISFALLFFLFVMFFFKEDPNNQIKIGTKNFSEQLILGEIMTQLLQRDTKLHVVKKFNLGGTFICHHALINGDIDMYPEYTGTGYIVILKENKLKNPQEIYNYLQKVYQEKFHVTWLDVFGFNNTNAVAISENFASRYSINSISDLKPFSPSLIIGVPADFMERPDGFVGLKQIYQLRFESVKIMDPGLMYKAVQINEIGVIMAFSTDGRIPAYHLKILDDDKQLFPAYFAAPIVRSEVFNKHPEIKTVLNKLAGKITNQTMQDLNYQVDVLKKSPTQVAKDFLKTL